MRVGIAIDVSSDVSDAFLQAHAVHVLPSTIHFGDASLTYDRDPARGLAFYRERLADIGLQAETAAFSAREIEELFLKKLVLEYDYVFLITLTASRSLTYENAHKASFAILQSYQAVRATAGMAGPFALRVIDSGSLFAGPGVLAWAAARMVGEQLPPVEMRQRLDELVPWIHTYLVPRDLGYLRARANRRGGAPVSWLPFLLARALDIRPILQTRAGATRPVARMRSFEDAAGTLFAHAIARIRAGLLLPLIGISYGGDPAEVAALPGYAALQEAARTARVEIMVSMMAPAAAINVGGGCLSLAYCGDAGEFAAR